MAIPFSGDILTTSTIKPLAPNVPEALLNDNSYISPEENFFPDDTFRPEIVEVLKSFGVSNNIKYEVIALHFLCAFGFSLCHKYEFVMHGTWKIRPQLWVISVGKSGTNKTGLINSVYSPIIDKDIELAIKYKNDCDIYDKQQKMEQLKIKKSKNPESVDLSEKAISDIQQHLDNKSGMNFNKPTELSTKNEDFTFAQILQQLDIKHNDGRQHIIIYDEMLGLFKGFNSYGGTHDEENYNKLYDDSSMTVKRKNGELNNIIKKGKCVCLAGTTQIQTLFQMFTPERVYNGNIYRHLFMIDDNNKFINPLNNIGDQNNLIYEENFKKYSKLILGLLSDYHFNINRTELKYTPEAFEYYKKHIDTCNKKYSENKNSLSVFGKMINTITKFAIIINRLDDIDFGCDDWKMTDNNIEINLNQIKRACRLNEYFINATFYVLDYTGNKANKVAENDKEFKFIDDLPQRFETSYFVDKYVALMNCSIRKAKSRLADFKKNGDFKSDIQGKYYKP